MGRNTNRGVGMRRGKGCGNGRGRGLGTGRKTEIGAGRTEGFPQANDQALLGFLQSLVEFIGREQDRVMLKEQARAIETQIREIKPQKSLPEEYPEVVSLIAEVNKDKCMGCFRCSSECPTGAISMVNDIAVIKGSKCTGCGKCISLCPEDAIVLKSV